MFGCAAYVTAHGFFYNVASLEKFPRFLGQNPSENPFLS